MTMQQVMEIMQGLQEAMAVSKAEQERMQADLAASQARNEELCRTNEELRRRLSNSSRLHDADDHECYIPPREFDGIFMKFFLNQCRVWGGSNV